ncbi:YlbF family regulator [Facklamia sp. P12950]|uniref:YlbF family regulator n=1 Tax=Facklamia sp. P12950 TaxID=3421951 RepID=UPI003D1816EB
MNINIYDTANTLERELRQLPAYLNVKSALEEIKKDPESNQLFEEFRQVSQSLQTMTEQPSEEKITEVQNLYAKVMENPLIKKLMENEQQLGFLMEEINQIITKPLQDLYQAPTE